MLIVRKGSEQHDPVLLGDYRPARTGRSAADLGIVGHPDRLDDGPADEPWEGHQQRPGR